MNEIETIGMNAVSVEELEQVEGGIWGAVLVAVGVAMVGSRIVLSAMESRGGGGGEALPGLGQFLVGTTAIATAAGGSPQ